MKFKKFFIIFILLISSQLWHDGTAYSQQAALQSQRPIVFSKPTELNWKGTNFDSINYSEIPVDGGASIYALPEKKIFKI